MYESLKDYEAKLTTGRPTLGTVLDNVKIYLMDDNLKLVPDGSQGEICISGDCLAMGYVGGKLDGGDGIFESGQFVKNPVEDGPGTAKNNLQNKIKCRYIFFCSFLRISK